MIRTLLVTIVISTLSLGARAQLHGQFPAEMLARLESEGLLQDVRTMLAFPDTLGRDLIIGFPNPNEVREINSPMTIYGDVIIANNAELRFNNTDVIVHGNIILVNNGKLLSTGGTLSFVSSFRYQRSILLLNKSAIAINGTTINLGGFNIGCGLSDTSIIQIGNATVQRGVMTTTVSSQAVFEAVNAGTLGEILFFDRSRGSFQGCDGLLTWTTTPTGASMDVMYPGPNISGAWTFPASAGNASGLEYSIQYEQCNNLRWGLIHEDGSIVQVRDSELLACGAIFNGPGQVAVSGLVNNTPLQSFLYPASDRDVEFTNTLVGAWNLYPRGESQVQISNCILGEVLCMGNGSATMINSICDGSGGFVGANDNSSLLLMNSQIFPDVIAKNAASIITSNCSITNGNIVSADNAVIALLNTGFSSGPVVSPQSIALVASVDEPSNGYAGEKLPVYGSIRLFRGEEVPVVIDSWWIDFGLAAIPDDRRPVALPSPLTKYREKLTTWDTDGLKPGAYALYLTVRLSSDDTLAVSRAVALIAPPVSVSAPLKPSTFRVSAIYPVPARTGSVVQLAIQSPLNTQATMYIFDEIGRNVMRREIALNSNNTVLSVSTAGLAPGTYHGIVQAPGQKMADFTFKVTR